MPIENYDQSELLAYVEQQLDPHAEAALMSRLHQDPQLGAVLDLMRQDRRELRAMPQPAPPLDLIAALEARLARPMLLEHRAGAYRRAQRRHRRAAQWPRLAAAAMLLAVLGGGLWGSLLLRSNRSDDSAHFAATAQPAEPSDPATADPHRYLTPRAGESWPPPGTTIHHRHPLPSAPTVASREVVQPDRASAGPHTISFLLVMESRDVAAAESALVRVLEDLRETRGDGAQAGAATALVRNFTFDEGLALLKRPHPSLVEPDDAPRYAGDPRGSVSSAEGDLIRRRVEDVVRRIDRGLGEGEGELEMVSRQLSGERELAPTYAEQLQLSRRGATHTVVLPSALVAKLLERLEFHAAARTMIEPLPAAPVGHPPPGGVLPPLPRSEQLRLQRWMSQREMIREQLLELRRRSPEGVVLLPIAIVPR